MDGEAHAAGAVWGVGEKLWGEEYEGDRDWGGMQGQVANAPEETEGAGREGRGIGTKSNGVGKECARRGAAMVSG